MEHTKAATGGQIGINSLKLLLALDALLREGSVTGAAASLGMQISSVSRMLGELRTLYGDPIFIRTGRGLKATPFAESLRLRVRSLAEETDAVLKGEAWHPDVFDPAPVLLRPAAPGEWQQRSRVSPPPLAVTRGDSLEAEPTAAGIARRIATIGSNSDPHRRLAKYIALTSSGPGRSRPLEIEEAQDAMAIILRGEADPVQVGGLLMTLHYRGTTALELAGFVCAIRNAATIHLKPEDRPDLDWPVYVSPRWRSPPWFIHAARLVAAAGHRVVMHGHFGNGPDSGKLETAAAQAGILVCTDPTAITAALRENNIAFVPLGAFAPQVHAMLNLYPLLETRTPINQVVPLINPFTARASLLGAAGGYSKDLYRQVIEALQMDSVTLVSSTRSFAQVVPTRATTILRILRGWEDKITVPAQPGLSGSGAVSGFTQQEYWQAVWSGAARDKEAESTVILTAAAALLSVSKDPSPGFAQALQQAVDLWAERRR
ncbi:MAG: glycosyl transferase family protein [Allorhizobium sp.]